MLRITEIKNIIKNSKYGYRMRIILRPYFVLCYIISDFKAWLRHKGITSPYKYQYLKKWKNSHIGEKCFIVATGPSLTYDDLNAIACKGFFSFGMNSCVMAFNKTLWRPNILGVQDEFVYEKIESYICNNSNTNNCKIWLSNLIADIFPSAKQFYQFDHHYLDHKYDNHAIGELKFSDDCYKIVYDAYSILFSLMQLAIYMGFKEIYLIGTDCNYTLNKAHFLEAGNNIPNKELAGIRLIAAHKEFRKFADAHGVKVVNCTRGGMLEEYPRMTLEEVLGE